MSILSVAPAEVLRQVRRIEVRARRLVDSHFAGEYRSLFKGQGMEFAEVREYQPGDEVRSIDWNVSARMGRPFVKRYVEERELTIMLALDLSGSSRFGTRARFKHDLAIELAGVLSLATVRNNDRVGLMLFSDRVEHALPARKGRKHALRLIRDLMTVTPEGRGTSFAAAVDRLMRLLPHRSVIFLASDFLADDLEKPLARLAQRHDVIAVTLEDPSERVLPDIGAARFEDPETGELVEVDTSHPAVRSAFATRVAEDDARRRKVFNRLGLDEIVVHTDHGYVDALLAFFRARSKRPHGAVRTGPRGAMGDKADAPAPVRLTPRSVPVQPAKKSVAGAAKKGALALAFAMLANAFQPVNAPAQAVSQGSLTQNGARVRAGFVVRPDTVTVGDRFTMIVTVDVPSSARIEWASIQDSTAVVAMGAPVKVTREQVRNGNEFRTERAEYTLTAWDVGMLPVGLPDATVRVGSVALKVPLGDARIVVKSVLPGDTTLHVPKPARDLFPRTVPWWQQWWLAMVIAALLGLLWWFWRRRAKPGAARERVLLDPYTRAMRDFERLDRLELADAGECGRYVALAVEVLRTYIVARIPAASLSLTSVELLVEISDDKRVPHDRLLSLLADADTIKFAGRSVTAARSRELAVDARRIVDGIEAAEKARVAAEAAARAAAVEAERAASKRAEDAARKESRRPKAGV